MIKTNNKMIWKFKNRKSDFGWSINLCGKKSNEKNSGEKTLDTS